MSSWVAVLFGVVAALHIVEVISCILVMENNPLAFHFAFSVTSNSFAGFRLILVSLPV